MTGHQQTPDGEGLLIRSIEVSNPPVEQPSDRPWREYVAGPELTVTLDAKECVVRITGKNEQGISEMMLGFALRLAMTSGNADAKGWLRRALNTGKPVEGISRRWNVTALTDHGDRIGYIELTEWRQP